MPEKCTSAVNTVNKISRRINSFVIINGRSPGEWNAPRAGKFSNKALRKCFPSLSGDGDFNISHGIYQVCLPVTWLV